MKIISRCLFALSAIFMTMIMFIHTPVDAKKISGYNFDVASSDSSLATQIGRTFYFESHGRDDRREWRAAFLKGLRVAKMDFNFQSNSTNCVQQTRINPNGTLTPSDFPNGCFVLSHYYDPSVRDYSLPTDILAFMQEPQNARDIFSAERTQQSGPVIIQMCLKNKPGGCCPIQSGTSCDMWLNLYDKFYAEAYQAIPDFLNEGRVHFVFDSIEAGDECYMHPHARYGNWSSTWTGNPRFAADDKGAHVTQQMPNMEWDSTKAWDAIYNLSTATSPNWGKFWFEATAFPIVAWEPSNEEMIKMYHEWFLAHAVYRPSGVLIAFNPDPMLFHVITSEKTKRFSHTAVGSIEMSGPAVAAPVQSWDCIANPMYANQNISGALIVSPLLMRCGTTSKLAGVECLFYQRGDHSQFILIESTLHTLPSVLVAAMTLPIRHMVVIGLSVTPSPNYKVFIIDNAGAVHTLAMSTPDVTSPTSQIPSQPPKWSSYGGCPKQFPFAFTGEIAVSIVGAGYNHHFEESSNTLVLSASVMARIPVSASPSVVVFMKRSLNGPINNPAFQCLALASQLASSPSTAVVANVCSNNTDTSICAASTKRKFLRRISADSSAIVDSSVASVSIATSHNASSWGTINSIVCYSLNRRVFCTTQQWTSPDGNAFVLTVAIPTPQSTPILVSLGQSPSVSFALGGGSSTFLIRYGNSFCQNTQLIDDNTLFFFGDHICNMRDATTTDLTSNTDLQGYLFSKGGISFLQQEIQKGNQHLNGFASVCNPDLMHGTFDSGSDAGTPLLYPANPNIYDNDLASDAFVAVVPLKSLFLITPSFCGSSNPGFGKLRLDAFPLPGMIFNYSASP